MFRIKTVKIKPLIACPQEPNKSKTSGKLFHNYVFKGNKKRKLLEVLFFLTFTCISCPSAQNNVA